MEKIVVRKQKRTGGKRMEHSHPKKGVGKKKKGGTAGGKILVYEKMGDAGDVLSAESREREGQVN